MIWGISEGRFAYISYDAYRKLHITADTKEQTFSMIILPADKNNYETIRTIMGKL